MKKISLFLCAFALLGCESPNGRSTQTTVAATPDIKKAPTNGSADSIPATKAVQEGVKTASESAYPPDINAGFIQKAVISLSDSSINVYQNIRADYRIFGYQQPDTNARKLILFSVFTYDVKDNAHNCIYGAYYDSGSMGDMQMKYVRKVGTFIEAKLLKDNQLITPIYMEKRWVMFEDQ